MDFNSLMREGQRMQEEMQRKEDALKSKEYVNRAGRGIVEVRMNGEYEVTGVKLDDEFVKNFTIDDREILEDSLQLAINDVTAQVTDDKDNMMGELAGSLNIPGLR